MSASTAAATSHLSRRHLITAAIVVGVPSTAALYYYGVIKPLRWKQRRSSVHIQLDGTSLPSPPLRRRSLECPRPPTTATRLPLALWTTVTFLRLVVTALPVLWYAVLARFGLCSHMVVAVAVRDAVTTLGPTFVKLTQWLVANSADVGSSLAPLNAFLSPAVPNARVLDWSAVEAVLRRDGVLRHLATAERVPIAVGSVAQVHRAILRDSVDGIAAGTAVALKVVHPHVRELIAADIAALSTAVSLLEAVVPSAKFLDLRRALGEFAALLESQLDLRRECDNLLQFRYNFCEFDGIVFPAPLPTLSTADVLVETFEEGLPLSSFECNNTDFPFGRRSLVADVGCHMFLKMLFHDNFVHSDLHPGNVLVRPRNPATAQRQPWWQVPTPAEVELVILDPGLVTVLSPEERDNFISLFAAVACGDGQLGAELMLDRMRKPCTVDREAFVREMTNIFDQVGPSSTGFKLSKVDLGRVLGQILNTVRIHGATIDGNFSSLVVTVIVGEAMGRKLTPDFNIFAAAAPYMIKYLENTELRFLVAKLSNTFAPTELLHETVTVDRTTTYLSVAQAKGLDLLDACIRAMHLA